MLNNNQREAIILKGIAHQILGMGIPTFNELNKMLNSFEYKVCLNNIIFELEHNEYFYKNLVNDIKETVNPSICEWIDNRIKEHEESIS